MSKLATENRPIPGPPLPGGRPRKRAFVPRPNRAKYPPDLMRKTTFSGKLNGPCHRHLMGLCDHLGINTSEFVYRAAVMLAAASGYEPPPPFALIEEAVRHRRRRRPAQVAESATPALPGLDAAGTGQLTADGPPSA